MARTAGNSHTSHELTTAAHRLATEYRDAGISIVPMRLDGSKWPTLDSWKPYQSRIANDDELSKWFSHDLRGVGIVCGFISGGLEVLDFDDGSLFEPWRQQVKSIVERLPVVETGGGGWHVLFRCYEIGGNVKIACDPQRREKETLIEAKGEGGLIVAEGNPCAVHKSGLPYVQYSGPYLPQVPMITPGERIELWRAARTFDMRPKPELASRGGFVSRCDDHRPLKDRKSSAAKYIAKMEPSISGCSGHNKAYSVARVLVHKFGLPHDDSLELFQNFNSRCVPPWTEKEMVHKLQSAGGAK